MDPEALSTVLDVWGYPVLLLLLVLTGVGSPIPDCSGTTCEDGTLCVYKRVNNTLSLVQTAATAALSAGQSAQLKAEMTSSSQWKLTRLDGTPVTLTVNDGSLRGGYFRFGHNVDSGWSFSSVSLG